MTGFQPRKRRVWPIALAVALVIVIGSLDWRAGGVMAGLVTLCALGDYCAERFLGRPTRWIEVGRCPACGYDLRETPHRCPECGTVPPHGARIPFDSWLKKEFEQASREMPEQSRPAEPAPMETKQ